MPAGLRIVDYSKVVDSTFPKAIEFVSSSSFSITLTCWKVRILLTFAFDDFVKTPSPLELLHCFDCLDDTRRQCPRYCAIVV